MEEDQHMKTAFLVNTTHNPDASFDRTSFTPGWSWIEAPLEWKPEGSLPEGCASVDLIIVCARKYAENEALAICKAIKDHDEISRIPLLVAISMYQMPLGNDVKRLPDADMIFMPIEEKSLLDKMSQIEEAGKHAT